MNKRCILIGVGNYNPDGSKTIKDSSHRATWPYLGILIVGTVIEKIGFEVVLVDENVDGPVNLQELIKPGDIVGLSSVVTSMRRGLFLAQEAKRLGAGFVFMGNDQASARAKQILKQHESVDGVFLGDGLVPIKQIFSYLAQFDKLPDKSVAGFALRVSDGNVLIKRSLPFKDISDFPVPRFSLFPQSYWNKVWDNHKQINGFEYLDSKNIKNCSTVLASGCPHGRNACNYCAIYQVSQMRWADKSYYLNLVEAYKDFGINSFYETCDDLSGFGALVHNLKKYGILFDNLTCYARAFAATYSPRNIESILSLVKSSGHLKFNVGLDSGDDMILREGINKGTGIDDNVNMVKLMARTGIWGHFSFIFGSPGESRESCKRTLEFIEWIFSEMGSLVANIEADIWWVNHGAPCERIFYDYEFARTYSAKTGKYLSRYDWHRSFNVFKDSIVVPWGVQENWYRWFTNIDIEFAEECNARVRQLAKRHGANFGRAYGMSEEISK